MLDKRKEKLGKKKYMHVKNICMKIKCCSTVREKGKGGYLNRSGDFSNAQNRFGVEKNCLGRKELGRKVASL